MSKKINESLPMDKRLGQIGVNNQNLQMVIIEYRGCKNINVQFEDGTIVENREYCDFLKGSIANLNYQYNNLMNDRIGETNINNQEFKMTIIEYKNFHNIDVRFEDGTVVKNKSYDCFKKGSIANPNYRIGEININNQGLQMIIVKYKDALNIDVQFEDGTVVENKRYDDFKKGNIINCNYQRNLKYANTRIGETKINNQGLKMIIIGYKNSNNIDVQFEDGTIVRDKDYYAFLKGSISHPLECSDNVLIPNKMLRQISKQLGLNWQFEYSPRWLDNKRMDGYDDNLKIAIEMDAEYKNNHKDKRKEIDNWKDEQCLKHGIYVIRIDLMDTRRYINNKFEYIKEQILNSLLVLIYDFSNFDWELAWYNSLKNLVYEVKRLVEEGYNNKQIAEILDISRGTVEKYKKQLGIKTKYEIKQENLLRTKELVQQGKSTKEIAKILDVHITTIFNYKKELNL